jgi:hypothetical protein
MSPMQEDSDLAPWGRLGETLEGSFAARRRELLTPEFAIFDRKDEEIGRLEVRGIEGAGLEVGDLEARIESPAPAAYTMLSRDAVILTAEPLGAWSVPEIKCPDRLYQGRLSLLRNTAEAGPAGERATVRITGGLTNRNYQALFDASNEDSLPIAFFLLYLTVALRSKAYLTAFQQEQ